MDFQSLFLRRFLRFGATRWTVGSLVILTDEHDKVCLLKHRWRKMPWGLPGGLANWPETPAQAAIRETVEELNLTLSPSNLRIYESLNASTVALLEMIYIYEKKITESEKSAIKLQAREVLEMKWVSHADLIEHDQILERHRNLLLTFFASSQP